MNSDQVGIQGRSMFLELNCLFNPGSYVLHESSVTIKTRSVFLSLSLSLRYMSIHVCGCMERPENNLGVMYNIRPL